MPQKKSYAKGAMPARQDDNAQSLIHIRLAEPAATRRAVLNLTLDTIQILRRHSRLEEIRAKKKTARQKLSRTCNEMRRMASALKLKELPATAKPKKEKEEPQKEMPEEEEQQEIIKAPRLSPLEQEIESIRNKLSSL